MKYETKAGGTRTGDVGVAEGKYNKGRRKSVEEKGERKNSEGKERDRVSE